MKVKKTTATRNELSTEIDLFEGIRIPKSEKVRVAKEVGEFLKDEIAKAVGSSKSPLQGGRWPGLSREYKKFKRSQNLPGEANLEFSGDMQDNFKEEVTASGALKLGWFNDSENAKKADGHNNFSGSSDLPLRRQIPSEDDQFKSEIRRGVDSIIAEAVATNVRLPVRKLQAVTTKTGLFAILSELFPGFTRPQIRDAVLGDDILRDRLNRLNLLRFIVGQNES